MNILDIVAGPVLKIIDKLIPDPQAKAQMQLEAMKLAQNGEFKELDNQLQRDLAQIQVNNTEAQSESPFKSYWRPFVGWVCGFALAYEFLGRVLLGWILSNWLHW